MLGTIKTLTGDRGFGFIAVDGQRDEFFHSRELIGVMYDELRVGDMVTFDVKLASREESIARLLQKNHFLLPYREQSIVSPNSFDELEFGKKATSDLILRLNQNPLHLHQFSARQFEELVAELYAVDGYDVELIGSWNQADGGVDIMAVKRDVGTHHYRMAIQCKRYGTQHRISAAPIRALAGVLDRFKAHAGALVTTSDFTEPASREASYYWRIDLVNYLGIVEHLKRAKLLVQAPTQFPSESSTSVNVKPKKLFRFAADVSRA
jgi:cold shock protein